MISGLLQSKPLWDRWFESSGVSFGVICVRLWANIVRAPITPCTSPAKARDVLLPNARDAPRRTRCRDYRCFRRPVLHATPARNKSWICRIPIGRRASSTTKSAVMPCLFINPSASAASTSVRPHHVTQAAAALLSIDCARAAPARLRRPRAAISSARLRFPCAAWGSTLPYDPSCTATGAHWLYDGGSFPTAHGTHGRFHGHGWWLRRITAAACGAHGGPSPAGSADQPAQPRRGLLAPLASSCADHHDGRARHRQPQPYRNVGACTSPLASERGRHERGKHVHTAGDHRSRGASTDRRGHRGNGGSRFSVC